MGLETETEADADVVTDAAQNTFNENSPVVCYNLPRPTVIIPSSLFGHPLVA
jgi:hypothetical protein